MFSRLVETLVYVGRACKRGTADRKIVPAEAATSPCFLVFGEETDVAASASKAAGVQADVCLVPEDEREVYGLLGGAVTENDALTATTAGVLITTTTIGDYYVGFAAKSGASGDVIPIIANPGRLYRPTA